MRSTDVVGVFGPFFVRPDGFESSDFAQIVDFYALSIYMGFGSRIYKTYWCLVEEGSKFEDVFQNTCRRNSKKSANIIVQRLAQPRFQLIWGSIGSRGPGSMNPPQLPQLRSSAPWFPRLRSSTRTEIWSAKFEIWIWSLKPELKSEFWNLNSEFWSLRYDILNLKADVR